MTVTVSPKKGYEPRDILQLDKRQKEEREKCVKEKELEKKNKEEDRKRKREETEKEKEERNRFREEKKAEKEKRLEKAQVERNGRTCKASCGHTCQTGPGWVGCDHCDVFWMCPQCYSKPSVKGKLTKHERACSRQKNKCHT